jgi:benzil reductase ((S)-benzoin forming)
MNYYFITGTGSGIGKALAEELLKEKENLVIGLSRKNSIVHDRFSFVKIDLKVLKNVKEFSFGKTAEAKKIILINNAGVISQIKRVGTLDPERIIDEYNVNLLAPAILSNVFVKAFKKVNCEKTIINISSGAGKSPIDAWSVYCSSKAGLDMFSKVLSEEQKIINGGFKVFAVSPGVVDTGMQKDIREADSEDFSRKSDFIQYQQSGQLAEADLVAKKIIRILASQNSLQETIISVKDF